MIYSVMPARGETPATDGAAAGAWAGIVCAGEAVPPAEEAVEYGRGDSDATAIVESSSRTARINGTIQSILNPAFPSVAIEMHL